MLRRLLYFAGKALASIRATPGAAALTTGTIGATLVVLGSYAVALQNLESLAVVWGRSATLTAYIADDVPRDAWAEVVERLRHLDSIGRADLVTPLQALERFRARGPQAAGLVEGVDEDILPASVELQLQGGFSDLHVVEAVAQSITDIPGVSEVDYGQDEFDRLAALIRVLRYGGLGAGILIALATALIVSNTIRLTVYARRDEIAILRLVGATSWFVRLPFLLEGALWGLGGGLLGSGVLVAGDRLLAPKLSLVIADVVGGLDVHLFALDVGAGLLAAGVTLGVVGSALAVRRFLDLDTDLDA